VGAEEEKRKKVVGAIIAGGILALVLLFAVRLARAAPPVLPPPADWFKQATEIEQAELPNYWEWGGPKLKQVVCEYDVDHDDDKEVYFTSDSIGIWLNCALLAWAKPRARLARGTYLRGSVSGYFFSPLRDVDVEAELARRVESCTPREVLRFIIRDETAGIDYLAGFKPVAGYRLESFSFPFDWELDPEHVYSLRFEVWNYFIKGWHRLYCKYDFDVLDRFELWVEDMMVETDARLKL